MRVKVIDIGEEDAHYGKIHTKKYIGSTGTFVTECKWNEEYVGGKMYFDCDECKWFYSVKLEPISD